MASAVINQPTASSDVQIQMMANPGAMQGVPPGLEYLTQIDQIIIKQQVEMLEVLTGFECKNKYRLMNSVNQQVYFAFEESSLCMRLCCGPGRGFVMHVTDNYQQEVLTMERVFRCCAGCCWCADGCCKYPIVIRDKLGHTLGSVRMQDSKCYPHFGIFDENEVLLYDIWGPLCPCQCVCGCTKDIKFPMRDVRSNTIIGNISKIWGGAFKEMITDADTFGVTFPLDLDARHKALMIAAVFCIEFMMFEHQNNNN